MRRSSKRGSSKLKITFAVVSMTAVALPVVAWADAPPTPLYRPRPGVLTLPPAQLVYVPKDGDITAINTTHVSIVAPPGGSPVRLTPVEKTAPPHASDPNVAPFICIGKSECYFTRYPFYNQGNPNFAYVDAPPAVYAAEKTPIPGSLNFDQTTGKWVFIDAGGTADPFFASWLPWGPLPGDPGSIGKWFTAICGPTGTSMAIMGALAARTSTTQVVPGSWMDVSFVHGTRPSGQAALPSPLVVDHSTVATTQMTATEIQRVINTAELLHTDPTAGGGFGTFGLIKDQFRFSDTAHPHQVATVDDNTELTPAHLVEDLRNRYSMVIAIHPHTAHLKPIVSGGHTTGYDLTFTLTGGHCLAIAGFSGGDTATPTFTIYDPVYAAVIQKQFVEVRSTGITHGGLPLTVHLPSGGSSEQTIKYDNAPPIAGTGDIKDGDSVIFVDWYNGLHLE